MGKKGKERFHLQNIERHVIVLLENMLAASARMCLKTHPCYLHAPIHVTDIKKHWRTKTTST